MRQRAIALRRQVWLGLFALTIGTAGCGRPAAPPPRSRAGLELLRAGQIQEAVALLERADEQAPGDATTLANLGLAYAHLDRNDRAESYLKQAAQATPHDPRLHELLGYLYLRQSRWPAARSAFEEAHRRLPVSPKLITARALVEFHAGEFGRALTQLKRALDLDPDYPPALYNLGLLYRENPDTQDKAQVVFGRFLATLGDIDPGDDPRLARRQQTARAFLDAVERPQRQPASEPADTSGTTPEPTVSPESTASSDVLASTPVGDQEVPAPETEQVPEPAPAASPARPSDNPAVSLMRQAQAAVARESFDEALIVLKQATSRHPDDADALWALVVLYDKHLVYTQEARRTYALFRKRFPDDPRQVTFKPEPPPVPSAQPRPAPPLAPSRETSAPAAPPRPPPPPAKSRLRHAVEWQARGQKRFDQDDWDGAAAAYRQAVEYDPSLYVAWYNLGLAYRAGGHPQQVRTAFERAAQLKPEGSRAWYMLGVACYDLNQTADAVRYLNQALARHADHASAHYLLGLIYSQQQHLPDARRHFRLYLRLAPDSAAAEKVRIWMERHVEPR